VDNQTGGEGSPPQVRQSDPDRSSIITNRTDLIQALCDAAQLEQGLCCAYLYAAFSIKRRPEEGVPPNRLADLREWELVLLLIARQEMEHLGIVSNLLTAIGGMPYLQNPTFPIATDRYGDLPALPLVRFSVETIKTFIKFEIPEWIHLGQIIIECIAAGAANYTAALSMACQQICRETEWVTGDVWVPEGGTMVPALQVSGGLKSDYGPEAGQAMWARWQTPHPPRGEELPDRQIVNSNIVNTFVEIPVYDGEQLKYLWRFFYETFRTFDEDDAIADAIELMLSGPDSADLRNKIEAAKDPVSTDTGLRGIQPRYGTLGGFYRQIRKGFLRLCFRDHKPTGHGLFTGFQTANPDIGIADRNVHDRDLATVSGLDSALAAINQIIETGEGCLNKRVSSHYARLTKLCDDLMALTAPPAAFAPARATVKNPITAQPKGLQAQPDCTLLEHPDAVAVAEIFDAVYQIMLQMVARFFAFPDDKVLEGMAFGPLMTMAVRPLAEILTELSASENSDQKAGPPFFSPTRDLLHPHRLAAWTVFGERLQEIALTCTQVQKNLRPEHQQAGQRLTFIGQNVNFIASRLKTAVEQAKAGKPTSGTGN
jgi:hypothetical protein